MFEMSILGLAGTVLGSAAAGAWLGMRFCRRWHEEEMVDLDALQADMLIKVQRKLDGDPRLAA